MRKLLDGYVKGCAWMHFYYGRLCPRPLDPNRWKAEDVSFLHVLLVWGVKLLSHLSNKMCQSWGYVLKQTMDRKWGLADKEIRYVLSQSQLTIIAKIRENRTNNYPLEAQYSRTQITRSPRTDRVRRVRRVLRVVAFVAIASAQRVKFPDKESFVSNKRQHM